jgi:plastocyanin
VLLRDLGNEVRDHLRKGILASVLVVLIIAAASFAFLSLSPPPSQGSSTTRTATGSSSAVVTTTGTVATTLDRNKFFVGLTPPNRIVELGGTMSFTLTLQDLEQFSGSLAISVAAPPGLTFQLNPSILSNYNSSESVDMTVVSSPDLTPGTYQATINVRAPTQAVNSTFDFKVVRNLIKIHTVMGPVVVTLTVKAGETVTWYNMDPPNDDGGTGIHNVTFQSLGASSGLFATDEVWSFTFQRPGVYNYSDNQEPSITGVITVTA